SVDSQREGGFVLHQRPADVSKVLLKVFRPLPGCERLAGAQCAAAQPDVSSAAKRANSRLRNDVDEQAAGEVIFRRKRIARDVYRLDLRLRWQLPTFETVDPNDGVRSRHIC